MSKERPAAKAQDPYLYLLVRTDIPSLFEIPGKGHAQAAHAANQFVFETRRRVQDDAEFAALFNAWETSTPQGFGTTICLDVDGRRLRGAVEFSQRAGFAAGVTHDPSYPFKAEPEVAALLWPQTVTILELPPGTPMVPGDDGMVMLVRPEDTCGYIFGDKSALAPLLRQFSLHP